MELTYAIQSNFTLVRKNVWHFAKKRRAVGREQLNALHDKSQGARISTKPNMCQMLNSTYILIYIYVWTYRYLYNYIYTCLLLRKTDWCFGGNNDPSLNRLVQRALVDNTKKLFFIQSRNMDHTTDRQTRYSKWSRSGFLRMWPMSLNMVQRMTSTQSLLRLHGLHTNLSMCVRYYQPEMQITVAYGKMEFTSEIQNNFTLVRKKSHKPTSKGVKELFLHTEQRHGPQNRQADTG